jgi:YD repeat-containing protein
LTDTQGCCGGLAHTFERQTGTNFILSVTDPLNRRMEYSYDAKGNVTSMTRLAGTGNAVTSSLTYEPVFNQVESITDPLNHTTTFSHDSKGNLTTVTDPLGHQKTTAYNSAASAEELCEDRRQKVCARRLPLTRSSE